MFIELTVSFFAISLDACSVESLGTCSESISHPQSIIIAYLILNPTIHSYRSMKMRRRKKFILRPVQESGLVTPLCYLYDEDN